MAKANPPEVGGDRKSEDFNVTQGHTEISGNAIRNMRQAHSRIPDKLRHSIINSVNDIAFCLVSYLVENRGRRRENRPTFW